MRDADLRAYAHRAWHPSDALEHAHWVSELARDPLATFRASQALWVHMRQVDPAWPDDAERRADLAHHVELKRAIDRAAGCLRRHSPSLIFSPTWRGAWGASASAGSCSGRRPRSFTVPPA